MIISTMPPSSANLRLFGGREGGEGQEGRKVRFVEEGLARVQI